MFVEELAVAARDLRAFDLRVMWRELLDDCADVASIPAPRTTDVELLAIAASLVELLASRLDQSPPPWASEVAPLDHPVFLVTARTPGRRERLTRESPEPLRKRRILAPGGFLKIV